MPESPKSTQPQGLVTCECRQFKDGEWRDFPDLVSSEVGIRLMWPGRAPLPLLAYPRELDQLAVGHARLELCPRDCRPRLERVEGDQYFLTPVPLEQTPDQPGTPPSLDGPRILDIMGRFIGATGLWDDTGCFHRMAVYDPESDEFICRVEDIGRHNCVDRVAAWLLASGADPASLPLFVSARATRSLVDKIVRAGFRMLVSRSAVTTGGIELAKEHGLSLAGFARINRFTVFSDANGCFVGA